MTEQAVLYDVVAVNFDTHKVRMIAESKTERNAEAIITMAVMRRGVEEGFYARASHGVYREGDDWKGER